MIWDVLSGFAVFVVIYVVTLLIIATVGGSVKRK